MPLSLYFGWGLMLPVILSLLYGIAAHRALAALGYRQKNTVWARLRAALPSLLLFTLWGMVDVPLPVIYILAFLGKLFQLLRRNDSRFKEQFIINLTHLMTMALHMVLIGVFSICVKISMNDLLKLPFWRIATMSTVLAVNILFAWLLPRWSTLLGVLLTQSESEEVRPFLTFLWFCNLYLLLDSVLCVVRIDWKRLPVFLIGSTLLMEFYLIRFLGHLYSLLKVRYLEEEHEQLIRELARRNQSAEKWRSIGTLDSLTGIFSRRYIMEHTAALLQADTQFSLVFIDLDCLKQINDRQGHHAGDHYLIQFAKVLQSCLRGSDIFARVGGDEFAVLFPECPMETAVKRMEEIRSRMTEQYSPPFSFSFGVSCTSDNSEESAEDLFSRADEAMYRDKKNRSG
ncbi:GGDEF domain-containing protein [Ruminococcus gauvreauii]|uniref:GGDEF domain-containing protein n=1 Tax=Ruminococcus gauvreauii TaxID=438033 RepID=A0ABY5VGP7_9FIRM|nr:GGDEF domain-containing protein [Ruminococcus gauvreauii]UWP59338.1 GGDEF domain-containing protein [Ruminococcus gauvreauii]